MGFTRFFSYLMYFYSLGLPIFLVTFPLMHTLLQEKKIFRNFLLLSLGLLLLQIILFIGYYNNNDKINSIIVISPITFLIVYKKFNKIIQQKYNRNIYFHLIFMYLPGESEFKGDEYKKATPLEYWFQIVLAFIPVFWLIIICLIANY
jgi:hypothetical protein